MCRDFLSVARSRRRVIMGSSQSAVHLRLAATQQSLPLAIRRTLLTPRRPRLPLPPGQADQVPPVEVGVDGRDGRHRGARGHGGREHRVPRGRARPAAQLVRQDVDAGDEAGQRRGVGDEGVEHLEAVVIVVERVPLALLFSDVDSLERGPSEKLEMGSS